MTIVELKNYVKKLRNRDKSRYFFDFNSNSKLITIYQYKKYDFAKIKGIFRSIFNCKFIFFWANYQYSQSFDSFYFYIIFIHINNFYTYPECN